jgi:hypothetical protein
VVGATPARCEALVELPFEAYGERLHLRLKPAELRVGPVELTRGRLHAALLAPPPPARPRPPRPKACVPPQYCRN